MSSPRRLLVGPIAAVAALVLAGCGIGDDGPRTTQTRDVAPFTRIDNDDSVDVRIHVGERRRVQVRAGEKVIDDVRTEVRDGTLELTFDDDGFGDSEAVVDVSVPELTGVEVDGSGDVAADGVDADAFELRSDGSGDITLGGTVGRLGVFLDGSGDADLANLAATAATVTVGGSGDARVRADEHLDVAVDGSGDVRYYGDPALTQHLDGSGELSRAS
jgi:hypothetical protein